MLAVAHMGITLGAASLLNRLFSPQPTVDSQRSRAAGHLNPTQQTQRTTNDGLSTNETNCRLPTIDCGLINLGKRIDIRVLLVGSLFPDIIDKPLGMVLLGNVLGNGRIFCHTLLFLVVISSFGTLVHLILDQTWLNPETLLWPVYGILFPKEGVETVLLFPKGEAEVVGWLEGLFYALHTEPSTYVPEIIGAAILVWFAATLVYEKRVYSFVRNGYLDEV